MRSYSASLSGLVRSIAIRGHAGAGQETHHPVYVFLQFASEMLEHKRLVVRAKAKFGGHRIKRVIVDTASRLQRIG